MSSISSEVKTKIQNHIISFRSSYLASVIEFEVKIKHKFTVNHFCLPSDTVNDEIAKVRSGTNYLFPNGDERTGRSNETINASHIFSQKYTST